MGTKSDRLILSPYIVDGNLSEAKELAYVNLKLNGNRPSYSGFLTVDERYDSNIFFWFFPTENIFDPVVLWLQGGPGNSSLFGLFCENGPVSIDPTTFEPVARPHAWTEKHSVLYMDSPIGSGFSYTDNEKGYSRSYADARNLYSALVQFFTLFPDYVASAGFYIAAESIGGKTAVLLAHEIHKGNSRRPRVKINLKGIASFSSYIDPESIAEVSADFFFNMGVFDEDDRDKFHAAYLQSKELKDEGKNVEALHLNHEMVRGDGYNNDTHFGRASGFSSNLNLLESEFDMSALAYIKYINSDKVRQALHVGDIRFQHNGALARKCLYPDAITSEHVACAELLNLDYNVLLTGGQFDVIVPYTAIKKLVDELLVWKGKKEFNEKKRIVWKLRKGVTVAGYIKQHKNLVYAMIRNAGHVAIGDQQEAGLDLIYKFTHGCRF